MHIFLSRLVIAFEKETRDINVQTLVERFGFFLSLLCVSM